MKYLILIIAIFFIGCEQKTKKTYNKEKNISNITKNVNKTAKNFIIQEKDFNITFKNNKLVYPNKKIILLFYDNNFYSKEEIKVLRKLNVKFYKTNNEFLKKYFKIEYYPTIVILDKNKTIKFENFTPYEILKDFKCLGL